MTEFTKASLDAIQATGKQQVIWDNSKQGVSGLCLIVSGKGAKSFYLRKKVNGKSERIHLGSLDDIKDIKTLREKAEAHRKMLADGLNSNEAKRKLKGELTFGQVAEEFISEKRTKAGAPLAESTKKDYRALLRIQLASLADLKISRVNIETVERLKIASNAQGNRAKALLSAVWKHAVKKRHLPVSTPNFALGLDSRPTIERDRFIKADEMGRFLAAVERSASRDFWMMLLLTGQRKSNVLSMAWGEIDLDEGLWRIPASKMKNRDGHTIPLVDEVIEILTRRRVELGVVDKEGKIIEGHTPWVFPSDTSESGHLTDPKKQWRSLLAEARIQNLRIHDIRRTMGSWQAGRKESLTIIGKALGHKTIQATKIYAKLDHQPVRDAFTGAVEEMLAHRGKPRLRAVK